MGIFTKIFFQKQKTGNNVKKKKSKTVAYSYNGT